jgi:hypothetical protein
MFVMVGVVGFGLSKQTLHACNNAGSDRKPPSTSFNPSL